MRRLVARLARVITRTRPVVQEDVCWCGIHHLGTGYVHERPHGRGDLMEGNR